MVGESLRPGKRVGDVACRCGVSRWQLSTRSRSRLSWLRNQLDTDANVADWTIDFYNAHGKKAIRLNHEAPGHLVNRLQTALWREAMDAVLTGLASVEDVDDAIKYRPGLRLSVMGPFELCHLAGGPGGFSNFLDHFGDALQHWMDDMRPVELTPEVRAELKALVAGAVGERGTASIAKERDTLLLPVLRTLARTRREHGLYRDRRRVRRDRGAKR